jgi:hypothetical protein
MNVFLTAYHLLSFLITKKKKKKNPGDGDHGSRPAQAKSS